jgi:hypothetical protein
VEAINAATAQAASSLPVETVCRKRCELRWIGGNYDEGGHNDEV